MAGAQPDISSSSSPSLRDSSTSPDRPFNNKDALYERQLLEELVDEIASVRKMGAGGSDSSQLERKRMKRELEMSLKWLRGVALNPVDPALVVREREQQILIARREMYLKIDDVSDLDELPDFAPLRKKKKVWQVTLSDELYRGKRRSERITKSQTLSLSSHLVLLRNRIGIGDLFQAQIPTWAGPPSLTAYKTDPNRSKYTNTLTWPVSASPAKNLRSKIPHPQHRCNNCVGAGAGARCVECVRRNVDQARTRLRSELGAVYYTWGFDSMGELMCNTFLTRQEQALFEEGKTKGKGKGFWGVAGKSLERRKKRRDLVCYYFNVYLMRRVAAMSRARPVIQIDSDEEDEEEAVEEGDAISQPESSSLLRSDKSKRRRC